MSVTPKVARVRMLVFNDDSSQFKFGCSNIISKLVLSSVSQKLMKSLQKPGVWTLNNKHLSGAIYFNNILIHGKYLVPIHFVNEW